MQRRAMEMLPGCGMVLARQLLQHFGSVRRIVSATPDELRLVRGLGARKAADINKVVSAEYEAVDTERDLEDANEAYQLSLEQGYIPYVTRRSLSQLTTTPPPGLPD